MIYTLSNKYVFNYFFTWWNFYNNKQDKIYINSYILTKTLLS